VAGLLVSTVALLRISVPLGLLVLLGTPPLLLLTHLIGRPLERRSGVEQERAAHASGIAADLVTGLRVLKGIGAESAAVARYRHTSRISLAATLRAAKAQSWHDGAILALTGVFIATVALVGGQLAVWTGVSCSPRCSPRRFSCTRCAGTSAGRFHCTRRNGWPSAHSSTSCSTPSAVPGPSVPSGSAASTSSRSPLAHSTRWTSPCGASG
jgi:ABC-type multidrug transport system fused ATPase/permease subunit